MRLSDHLHQRSHRALPLPCCRLELPAGACKVVDLAHVSPVLAAQVQRQHPRSIVQVTLSARVKCGGYGTPVQKVSADSIYIIKYRDRRHFLHGFIPRVDGSPPSPCTDVVLSGPFLYKYKWTRRLIGSQSLARVDRAHGNPCHNRGSR